MTNLINRQFCLASRPVGYLKEENLVFREVPVPQPSEGEVLVRVVYLSLDPTNRIWMSNMDQYMPPVELDAVMRGITLGVVEESRNPKFAKGDLVTGMLGWQEYALAEGTTGSAVRKLPRDMNAPLPAFLGPLGLTGCTAYFGLLDVGKPSEGDTVVVSAAAGAVGSIVGQIAKIKGCRAVGIAGSAEKCRLLTGELGFDAAINYKTDDLLAALDEACPDGIDVYFENVGGKILDAVLTRMNLHARVVLCGLISQYNATRPKPGPFNFSQILMKRVHLEGFIVLDYITRWPEAIHAIAGWIDEGRMHYAVDIVEGLENAPAALGKLFDGTNKGKLIIKVSEEP